MTLLNVLFISILAAPLFSYVCEAASAFYVNRSAAQTFTNGVPYPGGAPYLVVSTTPFCHANRLAADQTAVHMCNSKMSCEHVPHSLVADFELCLNEDVSGAAASASLFDDGTVVISGGDFVKV